MPPAIPRKRTLAALLAVGSIALALVVSGSAAPSQAPVDRQAIAAHLLKTQAPRFMTMSAQSALRLMSSNDRQIAPALTKNGHGKLAAGGLAAPSPSFTNVRVNDPFTDGNQVDQTTQSETTVAVAGSKVAVGFNDSQKTLLYLTAASNASGYAYSSDGGATFRDGGNIPNTPEFVNFGDPWLASDRSGTMYYATLAFDVFNLGNLDIAVSKSTDGGKTWSAAVPISRPPREIFYLGDKPAMTVGPDPSMKKRDNLYVAWGDFVFDPTSSDRFNGLPLARSTDGGASWQISYADKMTAHLGDCSLAQYTGAQPFVDRKTGTLWVAAERISVTDPTCEGGPVEFSEWIFRSTDGGQSFGAGVKIADVTPSVPDGLLKLGAGRYMRNLEFPTLAQVKNALYVAWNDGAGRHSHIRLAKSTDGGQSWSLSWATQGANDEVQPALSGDSAGLHLAYYRRNRNNTLDIFLANSKRGTSFVAKRVTTRSSPGVFTIPQFDPTMAFGYMGDYIANVSDGAHQYLAWGDNRDRVTNYLWPHGRNDPNVYFARQ